MMADPFEELEERRARLIFVLLLATASLLLGGYFVVQKTQHDGDIARDTRRIAEALERAHPAPLKLPPLTCN